MNSEEIKLGFSRFKITPTVKPTFPGNKNGLSPPFYTQCDAREFGDSFFLFFGWVGKLWRWDQLERLEKTKDFDAGNYFALKTNEKILTYSFNFFAFSYSFSASNQLANCRSCSGRYIMFDKPTPKTQGSNSYTTPQRRTSIEIVN